MIAFITSWCSGIQRYSHKITPTFYKKIPDGGIQPCERRQAGKGTFPIKRMHRDYLAVDLKKDIAFLTPKNALTTTRAIGRIIAI